MIKCLFLHKSHKTPHCHLRQRGVLFWLGNRIHQIYFVTRLIIFSSGLLHTSWFAMFHRIRVLHRKPPNRFGQLYFDFSIGVQLWDISFHQGCTHWFRHSMLGSFAYWDWVPPYGHMKTILPPVPPIQHFRPTWRVPVPRSWRFCGVLQDVQKQSLRRIRSRMSRIPTGIIKPYSGLWSRILRREPPRLHLHRPEIAVPRKFWHFCFVLSVPEPMVTTKRRRNGQSLAIWFK